jgi:hypothetical protein
VRAPTPVLLSCIFLLSSFPVQSYDFDCDGAKRIVETLKLGPDRITQMSTDWFVKEQMSGWECIPDPLPPERNGRAYIEAIECVRSDGRTPVTLKELAEAGAVYKRNLRAALSCFPENLGSTPISYDNTSRGEGILVPTGEFTKDGAGREYHVLLEYTYFQDSDSPIYWRISARVGSPKPTSFAEESGYCRDLHSLLREAPKGFRAYRGRYDRALGEFDSTLMLPGARFCNIETDEYEHQFSCSWRISENPAEAEQIFSDLSRETSTCLGSKVSRVRDRENEDTVFKTLHLEDGQTAVRLTHGSRLRRGERIYAVRLYVEFDRD